MIIIDTSVWIDHLKSKNDTLSTLIDEDEILVHPFTIVELACGHIKHREETVNLLLKYPSPELLSDGEILSFISRERIHGIELGFVDTHLAASALLSGARLWTLDKSLKKAAARLNVDFNE